MSSISGLVAVLLMVLQWTGPGLLSPLRPICDLRVLDRFIMEARDTENALRGCKVACVVTDSLVVPLTNVDFVVWETKNMQEQALEVQSGLSLLDRALAAVRDTVSRADLQSLIDNNRSNIQSLGQVLRSLHFQVTHQVTHLSPQHQRQVTHRHGGCRPSLNCYMFTPTSSEGRFACCLHTQLPVNRTDVDWRAFTKGEGCDWTILGLGT